MTRSRTKKAKNALNHLVVTSFGTSPSLEEKDLKMVHLVQIEDFQEKSILE